MVNTLSQAAIGRAMGLSPAAITKLKGQGMPVDSVAAAQAWRLARQNVAAQKPMPSVIAPSRPSPGFVPPLDLPDDGPDEDHRAARTRREISEANLSEMREAEERKDLIRVTAVKTALASVFATTREGMMQLPARLAPLLAAESDPAAVQTMLETEIHQALQTLASAPSRIGVSEVLA